MEKIKVKGHKKVKCELKSKPLIFADILTLVSAKMNDSSVLLVGEDSLSFSQVNFNS